MADDKKKPRVTTFSTTYSKIDITIDGKAAVIQELSADALMSYMGKLQESLKGADVSDEKAATTAAKSMKMEDLKAFQYDLIVQCLTVGGEAPTVEKVGQWPTAVTKGVYELCQEVNGMTEGANADAKKE